MAENALTCNNSGRSRYAGKIFVASRPATARDLTSKSGEWQPHHHNVTAPPAAPTTTNPPRPLRRTRCVEIRANVPDVIDTPASLPLPTLPDHSPVPVRRTTSIAVSTSAGVGMAGELVDHILAELPALAALTDRDRLLAAAWLASLRSARTRRSYAGDLLAWQDWLADRGVEVLMGGRVQMDMWARRAGRPAGTPAG